MQFNENTATKARPSSEFEESDEFSDSVLAHVIPKKNPEGSGDVVPRKEAPAGR